MWTYAGINQPRLHFLVSYKWDGYAELMGGLPGVRAGWNGTLEQKEFFFRGQNLKPKKEQGKIDSLSQVTTTSALLSHRTLLLLDEPKEKKAKEEEIHGPPAWMPSLEYAAPRAYSRPARCA